MTKSEIVNLQRELYTLGFYAGPIDGIYGPNTERAYSDYWNTRHIEIQVPVVAPTPAKGWYASSALWGALVTILGAASSIAGWDINAESLKELLPAIITLLGGLAAWGGTIKRKAPIDPTLLARVGGHDLRLPSRVYNKRMPADDSRGAFMVD